MNCKDFEPHIFTYAELDAEERKKLDEHLTNCAPCSTLLMEVNKMEQRLSLIAEQKVFPSNAAMLTSKIMAEINNPSKTSLLESISFFLQGGVARYSLSSVCCGLLLVFLIELFPNEPSSDLPLPSIQSGSVILSSTAFRENLLKKKSKSPSYADCRSPFRSGLAIIDCMKSKMK